MQDEEKKRQTKNEKVGEELQKARDLTEEVKEMCEQLKKEQEDLEQENKESIERWDQRQAKLQEL